MSPIMVFIFALIIGIGCLWISKSIDGVAKVIVICGGILCCVFALYGIFTAFL